MEHAELISGALSDVKKSLFGLDNFPVWIRLFLQIIVPIVAGIIAATLLLQIIVKPILVGSFVNDNFGFTENGIAYMLQFAAVLFGFFCVFLVPLFQGFLYRLIRSDKFPDTGNRMALFFSGWRVNLVCLFYAVPLLVVYLISAGLYVFFADITGGSPVFDLIIYIIYAAIILFLIFVVVLFAAISLVHVARGASFKKAFSIRNSMRIIRQIGWYNYLLSMVICTIVLLLISVIFLGIGLGFAGVIAANIIIIGVYIFLLIPVVIFCCRYVTRVYDAGMAPVAEDIEDFDDF
ncbi:MAG: DUF4013 domain-containing protein [Methanocorpusculum sp.]|nr:DUF4013 domain-containing protein [Methanocorpusculum sp.]